METLSKIIVSTSVRNVFYLKRETAEEGGTTPHRAAESTVQTDPEEAGATANSGTDSSSDTTRRLDYWKKIFFVMLQELSQTKKPSRTITLI